ncbi:coenzyme Q-binding protein COQ10 homolog B, mitochondrial isoform X2 [Acanthochromis polyacanthus]|uniref:coenzyme Q-binding protein COQ10 homolog B, mitochondrial isoform X2 n=1 Tax=Acanthochromis polyacanthus TaxID=80966 RepID=UPI0022345FDF|nr:coenzyme Q-binding protein COQ10 homolog B, mitochondrial isoform X2 [Acanthochromis polyacanthus]
MARGGRSLRRVVECFRGLPTSASRDTTGRSTVRYLSSCGILMTRARPLIGAVGSARSVVLPARSFFNLADSFSKRKEYSERRIIGYSMQEIYDVVASVENYRLFVPWCKKSDVVFRRAGFCKAKLTVGFPPVVENYTSLVTTVRPHMVKMFSHLPAAIPEQALHWWCLDPAAESALGDGPGVCWTFFTTIELLEVLDDPVTMVSRGRTIISSTTLF